MAPPGSAFSREGGPVPSGCLRPQSSFAGLGSSQGDPSLLGPLLPGWQASVHREEKAGVLAPSRRIQSVAVETFDLQSFQGWVIPALVLSPAPGSVPELLPVK